MTTIFIDGHGKCEVWGLPKMSSPKQRKYRYVPESFTHPAKMHVVLCRKIIKTYTGLGEIVLDPMCGVSTTQIEAALLGRNAVGTDLEAKFIKISKGNIRLLKKLRTLVPKGEAVVLKGDARKLSELLLKQADSIVFSPPYVDKVAFQDKKFLLKHGQQLERGEVKGHPMGKKGLERALKQDYGKGKHNIGNLPYGVDAVVFSPPFSEAEFDCKHGIKGKLSPNLRGRKVWEDKHKTKLRKDNIGRLKHGQIDAIVTSPPFAGTSGGKGKKSRTPIDARYPGLFERCIGGNKGGISDNPANIDNRPYGSVDAIVTSPPYLNAREGGGANKHPERYPTLRGVLKRKGGLKESEDPKSIGNLPRGSVDAIITSPPYVDAVHKRRKRGTGYHAELHRRAKQSSLPNYSQDSANIGNLPHGQVDAIVTSPPYHDNKSDWDRKSGAVKKGEKVAYSDEVGGERENIGNIHYYDQGEPLAHKYSKVPKGKETYLSAMLQVYTECFKVLKSGGLMVLVIKDFIRNKKVVRLDLDTKRLCEAVGFWWVETKLFRLQGKSFWRVLYEQKHPEVDVSLLQYEFVEVFQKPLEAFA